MKTLNLSWLLVGGLLLVAGAFIIGRQFERTVVLQNDVGNLKKRVDQLEARNMRHEERWGWASRIGSRIPLIKHFFK